MTRFVSPALVAAALIAPGLAAAPALAQSQAPRPEQVQRHIQPRLEAVRSDSRRTALQPVMACGTDAATRRAYQREFGVAPVFVTAEETVAARRAGEHWSAPRCMTEQQYDRLVSSTQTRASL